MRNLRTNTSVVYYRLYEGMAEVEIEPGISTGVRVPKYSELKSARLCVSPNKGTSEANLFGTLLDYDRTMTTADDKCEIDETAVLWLDSADTEKPWNFVVTKKAPWKNSVTYAIKRVSVSMDDEGFKHMQEFDESRRG